MSEENLQDARPKGDTTRRKGQNSAGRERQFCLCGHRASRHAALKYSCHAPGNKKGFCACMRFIPRKRPV